jgi:hypothetical protein
MALNREEMLVAAAAADVWPAHKSGEWTLFYDGTRYT